MARDLHSVFCGTTAGNTSYRRPLIDEQGSSQADTGLTAGVLAPWQRLRNPGNPPIAPTRPACSGDWR